MSTTMKSAPVVRIFLTNLSRYAEGELVGLWLPLPATAEELDEAYAKIGTPEDEYFITDYESEFDGLAVGEYDNVNDLNDKAMTLADLDDYEIECINAMLSSRPENLQCYFDFEAFGRDMSFEGQYVFTDNGNCVEILR